MSLSADRPGPWPGPRPPSGPLGRDMPAARIRTLLMCACLAAGLASSGTLASPAGPSACLRGLAALDAGGQVVFETVALLTGTPGVATAPLHPLERGGVRWSRLELRGTDGGPGAPV